jgi:hypothetical protein
MDLAVLFVSVVYLGGLDVFERTKCLYNLTSAHRSSSIFLPFPPQESTVMKRYKFEAKIEAEDGGGAYVFFPFDTAKEFGTKGRVPVTALLDGISYTGSLFNYGYTQHMLGITKAIREQIGKSPGDTLEVVVWKDEEVRTVEVPAEFKTLMKNEGVLPAFEKLSYTHRKEYCRWITEAKKEETRARRLEKAIEMLKKGIKTPG